MAILPPGVSSADFSAALVEFAAAVGTDWVLASDEDLAPYRDHYSPVPLAADELLPSAAVAPQSVEQVQAVIRTANHRAAPYFQDAVAEQYSFNDHALRRFNETIKDAVDPNGILAPGRGGIWPKHLRGNRA